MLGRFVLLAMLFAQVAMAQQQESKMIERILNLDPKKANTGFKKTFETPAFQGQEFEGARAYGGVKESRTKAFSTREFFGVRNPWFGKKVFQTSAARELSKYVLADKAFTTRGIETREAPGADRTDALTGREVATRPYLGREAQLIRRGNDGKDRDMYSSQYPSGGTMSIDEVRQLLNRPR